MTIEQTPLDIEQEIEARCAAELQHISPPQEDNEPKISSSTIRECLWANEVGDGVIFATLHRNRLVYNHNTGSWLVWAGHSWELDRMQRALAATSAVVDTYKAERAKVRLELKDTTQSKDTLDFLDLLEKQLGKRINKLQSISGRENCLKAAASINDPLAITGLELDSHPMLLACANGVIDLTTGDFGPGRPEQYLTMASPIEFTGLNTPAPRWESFLVEIFDGDMEKVTYVIKLLGYSIVGEVLESIFPVFYGQHGRNGKTTIMELMYHILGPLAGPIPTEMLLRQRNGRSASGPSPDVMSLKGRRLAVASEPNEGERFDMGKIKKYSGRDTLEGRSPHDKYMVSFPPSHLLLLLTNEKPGAKHDDMALWERLRCVDFPFSFVSSPDPDKPYQKKVDLGLPRALQSEASGILASLVRGCLMWQKEGLLAPDSVKADTEQWRQNEDILAPFLEECCVEKKGATESAAILYQTFSKYWEVTVNKKSVPSMKKFGTWMKAKFTDTKSHGTIVYHGVMVSPTLPAQYAATNDIWPPGG